MTPLLELRNARKVFGSGSHETVALEGVSFTVSSESPTITGIVGESGSGKTTLARLMLGNILPTAGHVLHNGRDLASMSKDEKRAFRRDVQPIFQDPFDVFNPFYRIDHALTTPVRRFGIASSRAEARRMIAEAVSTVGLRPEETLGRFPHELSGGQCQRVMVARAFLLQPRIIVADEPVSMVDASLRATILASVQALNQDLGVSVIYITHDLMTAYQICDNIVVFYRGSVVEAGSVESVIRSPKHPYTQLLIASTPSPDPKKRWGEDAIERDDDGRVLKGGCKFAPRCTSAHEPCWNAEPPLYRTDTSRVVSCFLHDDAPALQEENIATVFAQRAEGPIAVNGRQVGSGVAKVVTDEDR
jgi:oligopeptide/dipeptide ABC transporter ATP-binding protein